MTADEWKQVQQDLEASRAELILVLQSLSPERFLEEGAGMGSIAHLGTIRQLMHRV